MLRRRGLVEEANKALAGDLPDIGDGPTQPEQFAPTGSVGLTKTGGGLGVGSSGGMGGSGDLGAAAKFCTRCGTRVQAGNLFRANFRRQNDQYRTRAECRAWGPQATNSRARDHPF